MHCRLLVQTMPMYLNVGGQDAEATCSKQSSGHVDQTVMTIWPDLPLNHIKLMRCKFIVNGICSSNNSLLWIVLLLLGCFHILENYY